MLTWNMRVLLIAEACNPEWVSVPLEGWSHSRAIASLVDAHTVTQVRNREAILRAGLEEGKDFTAIDSERLAAPIHRIGERLRGGGGKGWTTKAALSALSYAYFEHLVWQRFGRSIQRRKFDIVHRLTPVSPTAPSPLALRCRRAGVKFVIGPLNGGLRWPADFENARRREREWLSYLRSAYKLLPGYSATRRYADALIVGSRATLEQMDVSYRGKCMYVPGNAIDPARFERVRERHAQRPLRVVFVGRLVPYKGADMLIEAGAPLLRAGKMELEIIGDGPEMPRLREMIKREGVENAVSLQGWMQHERLQERLASSDVLAFPSIREFGGAVVLEAMAVGLVPIVVDYGGPGELVTARTGFLVPMGNRQHIVSEFRRVLAELANNPSKMDDLSHAAMRRARQQFTWEAKARQVIEVYQWVLDPSQPKPCFGLPLPDLAGLSSNATRLEYAAKRRRSLAEVTVGRLLSARHRMIHQTPGIIV